MTCNYKLSKIIILKAKFLFLLLDGHELQSLVNIENYCNICQTTAHTSATHETFSWQVDIILFSIADFKSLVQPLSYFCFEDL